jgi:ATP-dependent helicase/nuclease subunit A
LRLRRGVVAAPKREQAIIASASTGLPCWATRDAADEPMPPRPLAPSRLLGDLPFAGSPSGPRRDGFRIGLLVHKLLQLVPGLPEAAQAPAIERHLEKAASDLSEKIRRQLRDQVLAVLRHQDLAPVFAPGSRSEQALVGVVDGIAIAGQIDRMAVTESSVILVDFKTNRLPPVSPERTPIAYLRQMATYRALLRLMHPTKFVQAAIVWTETCSITWLPDLLLDLHLAPADERSTTSAA